MRISLLRQPELVWGVQIFKYSFGESPSEGSHVFGRRIMSRIQVSPISVGMPASGQERRFGTKQFDTSEKNKISEIVEILKGMFSHVTAR